MAAEIEAAAAGLAPPSEPPQSCCNGASTTTTTSTILIMEASLAVGGAASFVLGSVGFIWSTWVYGNDDNNSDDDWLLPYQFGCGLWILGCLLFLGSIGTARYQWLLLSHQTQQHQHQQNEASQPTTAAPRNSTAGSPSCFYLHTFLCSGWSVSEICQSACQLLFLVGCCFAFGTEDVVLENLAVINGVFLCGSLLLVVDVSHTVLLLLLRTINYSTSSSTTTTTNNNNNNNKTCSMGNESVVSSSCSSSSSETDHLALVLEGMVALSFVYASVLGGYGKTINIIRTGMPGWTIGSVASGIYPTLQLHSIVFDSRSTETATRPPTDSMNGEDGAA